LKKYGRHIALLLCAVAVLSACGPQTPEETEAVYTEADLAREVGVSLSFPHTTILSWDEIQNDLSAMPELDGDEVTAEGDTMADGYQKDDGYAVSLHKEMKIYATTEDSHSPIATLPAGSTVILRETANSNWTEVTFSRSPYKGYAKNGFSHAVGENLTLYAELPVEYGMARTNEGTYVPAYSRLVDVRKYFSVLTVDGEIPTGVDYSSYDLIVSMKLSTSETTIGQPFYYSNLCMVQYDLLPMMKKAIEKFAQDGYRIVIYDAYRPTGVQQRWFDVVRVHKWVADPSIGMGGIHDRGTALDISLMDTTGHLLEMPTPMHTFTEESARSSQTMTETARKNMDYMLKIMVDCEFTYINSEWWHFQDINTKYYLPTNHPIDEIPLVPSEATEIDGAKES